MKNKRIVIRPESSLEAFLCLPATISALRAAHPGCEIGVIGEECFREASLLLPQLDFFVSAEPDREDYRLFDLSNACEESWGEESADWKAYLQGCANLESGNPYHRIDLFKKATGTETVESHYELLAPACSDLPESLDPENGLRIALCAASLEIENMQAVLEAVSRLGLPVSVHLIGTVSEKRKSSLLLSAWDGRLPLVDLCGRQSLSAMAATFRLCDVAVTGPGSGALLSSGYGTFTLCVDEKRNPLHYPYGHGHLILQKSDSDDFPRTLSGLVEEIIRFAATGNSGSVPTLDQWQSFADERVNNYLSRIRLLATQRVEALHEGGKSITEIFLRPLLFFGSEYSDVLQAFYRLLWELSLADRHITTHELEILHTESLPALSSALHPLEQLYELANFGHTYSNYTLLSLQENDLAKAKKDSARLQEVEDLIYRLGKSQTALVPLCAFHEKRQQLLQCAGPVDLAEQMAAQFERMKARVLVLLDLAGSLFHTTLQSETALAGITQEEGNSDG